MVNRHHQNPSASSANFIDIVDTLCLLANTPTGRLKIEDEDKDWDFGTGAGFYVDATEAPWSDGYKMYSYITQELPDTVFKNFPEIDAGRVSITGHSMGGHGALTLVRLIFEISLFLLLLHRKKSRGCLGVWWL